MKNLMQKVVLGLVSLMVVSTQAADSKPLCPAPWICDLIQLKIPYSKLDMQMGLFAPTLLPSIVLTTEKIRAGYYPETGSFRGNILYFEGLGDSFVNHQPLFSKLSEAGYRVLAFDYMGQGGSSGKMNRTRIQYIPSIGNEIWRRFARDLKLFPQKTILGWSTGGLAAYLSASKNQASRVVLIAPGIAPNLIVGGGVFSWPPNKITLESLTSAAPYSSEMKNPHVDPIRPNSPAKVLKFALDLLSTAKEFENVSIPSHIPGLVLLSGKHDTYVDAKRTREILEKSAPHFKIIEYDGALHEIDNEQEDIQRTATNDVVEFLLQNP